MGTRRKSILRYGFHRTSECLDFEKSYICIQKCLDLKYDVAYADKNCYCTCYVKKDKAKYRPSQAGTQQRWKLGAPTTKLPIWAQKETKKPKDDKKDLEDENFELDDFANTTESTFKDRSVADHKVVNTTKPSLDNVELVGNTTANTDSSNTSVVTETTIEVENTTTTV
ncbi:unnamed protein product [Leptosia nina]|uniref:Uncharacterized protein n=1 Tax=Leptosia nina TaxID=320188 RepID=A0AAV1JN24_9NEOP